MTICTDQDGTKIYCSGLLDSGKVKSYFSRSTATVGATIQSAAYISSNKGKGGTEYLHFDVVGDSDERAGLMLTDTDEINGFFFDLARIRYIRRPRRLNGRRVDARFTDKYSVGVSVPKPEKDEKS